MRRRPPRRTSGRGEQLRLLLATITRLTADYWTVDELAAELHVGRRTVLRVLRELRGGGLPVQSELGQDAEHPRTLAHRLRARWWEREITAPRGAPPRTPRSLPPPRRGSRRRP